MIDSLQGVLSVMVGTGFALSTSATSLSVEATYQRWTPPLYDPATGDVEVSSPTNYAITVILVGYTAREVLPDVILHTDQKALVQKSDLPLIPESADTVLLGPVPWRVVQIQDDASKTIWILQLRRPSSEGAT